MQKDLIGIKKPLENVNNAATRSISEMSKGWDTAARKEEKNPNVMNMSEIPPPPSIIRSETDSFPMIVDICSSIVLRWSSYSLGHCDIDLRISLPL